MKPFFKSKSKTGFKKPKSTGKPIKVKPINAVKVKDKDVKVNPTATNNNISNNNLPPSTTKLQNDLRSRQAELTELTANIKQLNSRKRQLESQVITIKSELKLLSENCNLTEFSRTDFEWSQTMQQKLESVFGIKEFRTQQLAALNATMSRVDCLLVMPTGGGKSLVFQLPAILSPGITLVVSPLISLMEDQYQAMNVLKIPTAIFNSNTSKEETKAIFQALSSHSSAPLKLIYVTPEKLAKSKRLMAGLEKLYKAGGLARLVIDEVHCCSSWGHDFRPDYKFLRIMKTQFPNSPILGLTATATSTVIVDIQKMLNIESCLVFKDTFFRPNLMYEILDCGPAAKIIMIEDIIKSRFRASSGIIYCLTIKDTEEVASKLRDSGIKAEPYNALLPPGLRTTVQSQWYKNKVQVIVATIAFGMGINKLDLDFVIHYSMSKSIENYYQESGRAGRDGRTAYCILLYSLGDVFRTTQIMMTEKNGTRNVYNMLSYCLDAACRKRLMAEYFGDLWDDKEDLCKKHCDNCAAAAVIDNSSKVNVKALLVDMIKLIKHAEELESRTTLIKLMEALYRKGGNRKLRNEDVAVPSLSREACEVVVGRLLLDEYLQEEFHFTPYSTISYIVPGKKVAMAGDEIYYTIPASRSESIWKSKSKSAFAAKVVSKLGGGVDYGRREVGVDKDEQDPDFPDAAVEGEDFDGDLTIQYKKPGLSASEFADKVRKISEHMNDKKPAPPSVMTNVKSKIVECVDLTDEPKPKKFKFTKKAAKLPDDYIQSKSK